MQRETRIANFVLGALSALSLLLLSLPLSTPVRSLKAGAGYVLNPLAYHGEAGYSRVSSLPSRIRQLLLADIETLGRATPVVVFSARDFDRADGARVDAVLVKAQTSNAELLQTLQRALSQARPAGPPQA